MGEENTVFVEVEEDAKAKHPVLWFFNEHLDSILSLAGGVCILTAAILGLNEGNSYIYASSTDGDIYKMKAKKVKNVKEVKAVKHTAVVDSVVD